MKLKPINFFSYPRSGRMWLEEMVLELVGLRAEELSRHPVLQHRHCNPNLSTAVNDIRLFVEKDLLSFSHYGFHWTEEIESFSTDRSVQAYFLFRDAKKSIVSTYYMLKRFPRDSNNIPAYMNSLKDYIYSEEGVPKFSRWLKTVNDMRDEWASNHFLFHEEMGGDAFLKQLPDILGLAPLTNEELAKLRVVQATPVHDVGAVHLPLNHPLRLAIDEYLFEHCELPEYFQKYLASR